METEITNERDGNKGKERLRWRQRQRGRERQSVQEVDRRKRTV